MIHKKLDINKITRSLKIFVRVFCSKFPDIRSLFNKKIVGKRNKPNKNVGFGEVALLLFLVVEMAAGPTSD